MHSKIREQANKKYPIRNGRDNKRDKKRFPAYLNAYLHNHPKPKRDYNRNRRMERQIDNGTIKSSKQGTLFFLGRKRSSLALVRTLFFLLTVIPRRKSVRAESRGQKREDLGLSQLMLGQLERTMFGILRVEVTGDEGDDFARIPSR